MVTPYGFHASGVLMMTSGRDEGSDRRDKAL